MQEKEYLQLIQLIKISLDQTSDSYLLKNANYANLYNIAKEQGISNLTYYGIEKLNPQISTELYQKWEEDCVQAVVSDIFYQEECKLLKKHFQEEKIDHMLLKGIILKDLYPTTDMRTMGDIDILIKPEKRHKVRTIMESLKYSTEVFNKNNEDIYYKKPCINIEIHTELFEKKSIYFNFYKNIWKNLKKKNKTNEYIFTNDDFYIFLITHFAKHYFHAGSGIRNIIDIYLFRQQYANKLNHDYIKQQLQKMELLEFETDILSLINVWFSKQKPTKNTKEMQEYIFSSGMYGKEENIYYNQLKKYKNKTNYLLHRIFLPVKEMKNHYPILNYAIILLPFFWAYRLFITIIQNPKTIILELKNLLRKNK